MSRGRALIIDDEPDIRELLEITLARMDIETRPAGDLGAARDALRRERFDLCLTDMRLPDGDGIDLVREIAERHPALPVAVITAHGNIELAVEALKAGAFDFVSKPVDLTVLRRLVDTALRLREAKKPARRDGGDLLGTSPEMDAIRRLIAKLARSQAPVYISGESGTGKELVARRIHAEGPRRDRAFVAVNCGAIPHELMESEFFGHRKGSFTGAVADKDGLFQSADGGTLFLDEVADLPAHMQVKLLRAIQEKAVRPVGANREDRVDVRIISASHRNLGTLVAKGQFRQDLFYRINVIEVIVPPLRDRPADIALLAQHFLERQGRGVRLAAGALAALQRHAFPGNVRELQNILERATTLCENDRIEAADLALDAAVAAPGLDAPAAARAREPEPDPTEVDEDQGLDDLLGDIERKTIIEALEATRWNRTAAARRLGITFRALRYRLKKLGLE
ncbi:MAG: sigma-54-dependent Fis family transcriptional regulator [Chromatiales bacterium]|nr:sigma-54-dependent Fis family transcriptional regulator [Chromatiales bacterium]